MNYFRQYEREKKFKPGVIWTSKRPDKSHITKLMIIDNCTPWIEIKPLEHNPHLCGFIGQYKTLTWCKKDLKRHYVQSTN